MTKLDIKTFVLYVKERELKYPSLKLHINKIVTKCMQRLISTKTNKRYESVISSSIEKIENLINS